MQSLIKSEIFKSWNSFAKSWNRHENGIIRIFCDKGNLCELNIIFIWLGTKTNFTILLFYYI